MKHTRILKGPWRPRLFLFIHLIRNLLTKTRFPQSTVLKLRKMKIENWVGEWPLRTMICILTCITGVCVCVTVSVRCFETCVNCVLWTKCVEKWKCAQSEIVWTFVCVCVFVRTSTWECVYVTVCERKINIPPYTCFPLSLSLSFSLSLSHSLSLSGS